ncbi:DUF441 domain-containing protein [Sporomusa aerivorans]|uniref:DUF441 domain-containing protein n=1 Tax=Sporomusa aerivorans TaxID=204936 RepID=UPI00352A9CC3
MSWDNMPLLIILVLAVIGNNQSVSLAVAGLLLIKLMGCTVWFPYIENHGLNAGIIILTMAVLTPLAQGRVSAGDMLVAFKTQPGLIAIIVGIFVSWLATQGVYFLKASPEATTSLIVGTIVGVCFLQGLAVGPLIAGGIVAIIMNLLNLFTQ